MKKLNDMPWWAYIGLTGIRSRDAAIQQLIVLLMVSFVIVVASAVSGNYLAGLVFLLPVWQWTAMKWADKHSAWPSQNI
ncbi:hypothetical protein [Gilvimarinus xylanilyticus]|uniref:Uncharacterized protein n=1 Tax=Gilvimarinus xylanilyticus TaxID=2944139 RepID=A0A9X2I1E5_9GAMM|nr:hypothetical protein [Gilvimarinus xylanilyticus]MCP8900361.1 hypothetical protein [Gilvimarinus xylanilyticus]